LAFPFFSARWTEIIDKESCTFCEHVSKEKYQNMRALVYDSNNVRAAFVIIARMRIITD